MQYPKLRCDLRPFHVLWRHIWACACVYIQSAIFETCLPGALNGLIIKDETCDAQVDVRLMTRLSVGNICLSVCVLAGRADSYSCRPPFYVHLQHYTVRR
jgi:hypothetical protein